MRSRLSAIFQNLKRWYLDLRIRSKIMLVYLFILVFSLSVSSLIYRRIYYKITSDKVSELTLQILYSIKSNILSMLDNLSYNSKMIFSDHNIQALLSNPANRGNVELQRNVNIYLTSLIDSVTNISSIYLFDNYGNRYGVDSISMKRFSFDKVDDATWYDDVVNKKGYYILRLNAGEPSSRNPGMNYVSFIRVINDIELQKRIGILMINISGNYFVNCYKDIVDKYGTSIVLLDENNESIVEGAISFNSGIIGRQLEKLETSEYKSVVEKINERDYIVSGLKIGQFNWKIISSVPFSELSKESNIFYLVTLAIVLINGILLFAGAIFISRLITNPINKLLRSMKGIEKGEFKKVAATAGNDEIGRLRDGYNIMVSEIENLINRVITEQKTKRIAELNVLQAQIKPHFLYNTIGAMGYLAISGKNEQLYLALEALGGYYKTSLSNGSEVITIKEEIGIVRNYLTLQKLRYGDVFTDIYEVDENVYGCKILKLVLQPLVENALYHGIKPKGEKGIIKVSSALEGNLVKIVVEDDGVGMSEEELTKVIKSITDKDGGGFGLRGTIERLRIFYGIPNIYSIESRKRYGTKVTLLIPAERCSE